jgi:hypothetical protein
MSRFRTNGESQTALAAGVPSGTSNTTFNGFFAALTAGSTANFKLRRLILGVRAGASVPTSQQVTVAVYRVTARTAGAGFTTTTGVAMDPRGTATAITGMDLTTATSAATNGPTLAAGSIVKLSFNTQSAFDAPFEMLEELICDQGTANGIGFVNLGNALPAAHLYTIDFEWEE